MIKDDSGDKWFLERVCWHSDVTGDRENVDIDVGHNLEMKSGDLIEVTRSRISSYDFDKKESVSPLQKPRFSDSSCHAVTMKILFNIKEEENNITVKRRERGCPLPYQNHQCCRCCCILLL